MLHNVQVIRSRVDVKVQVKSSYNLIKYVVFEAFLPFFFSYFRASWQKTTGRSLKKINQDHQQHGVELWAWAGQLPSTTYQESTAV